MTSLNQFCYDLRYGYSEFVEYILENKYFQPDCTDAGGQSPMFYAIRFEK